MSPRAERVQFLRKQEADLQHWLDNWPPEWARRHVYRKKTRQNLETITRILRELGGCLIAGAY